MGLGDYQAYDWDDWSKLRPCECDLFVGAVRFRLRVPEVITLTDYERLLTVAFSRRNICFFCFAELRHRTIHSFGQSCSIRRTMNSLAATAIRATAASYSSGRSSLLAKTEISASI